MNIESLSINFIINLLKIAVEFIHLRSMSRELVMVVHHQAALFYFFFGKPRNLAMIGSVC